MNKVKSYVLLFALVSLLAVSAISCQKSTSNEEEVSGRPTISDENKKAIEDQVKAVDAAYDVNSVSGVYDTIDSGATAWKMSLFAAGESGALADTLYGLWGNTTGGGVINGKVTKDGKFAGEWKFADGSGYGNVILVFKKGDDGVMTFAGTWGNGLSAANGGTWTGTETANSSMTKTQISDLKAQYQAMEQEADDASKDDTEGNSEGTEVETTENTDTTDGETTEETPTTDTDSQS